MNRNKKLWVMLGAVLLTSALIQKWAQNPKRAPQTPMRGAATNAIPAFSDRTRTNLASAFPQARVPLPQSTNDSVSLIVRGKNEDFWAKMKAVHSLGSHLTTNEIASLYELLRSREYPPDRLTKGGVRVLKNDIINALQRQQPPPKNLGALLVGLFEDRQQDPIVRDYALQHLVTSADGTHQFGTAPTGESVLSLPVVASTLTEGLKETDSQIAGTALLGLNALQPADGSDAGKLVDRQALALAADTNANAFARAAAIQVCSLRDVTDAAPIAQRLSLASESLPLRIAAVNALGSLGGQPEIAALNELATGTEAALRPVALAALARLKLR